MFINYLFISSFAGVNGIRGRERGIKIFSLFVLMNYEDAYLDDLLLYYYDD